MGFRSRMMETTPTNAAGSVCWQILSASLKGVVQMLMTDKASCCWLGQMSAPAPEWQPSRQKGLAVQQQLAFLLAGSLLARQEWQHDRQTVHCSLLLAHHSKAWKARLKQGCGNPPGRAAAAPSQ